MIIAGPEYLVRHEVADWFHANPDATRLEVFESADDSRPDVWTCAGPRNNWHQTFEGLRLL